MGVTTVPAPRKYGGDVMQFLLGLSTVEEQKKARELAGEELEVKRDVLKFDKKRWRTMKGHYEATAKDAAARARQMDVNVKFEESIAEIKRMAAVASAAGEVDKARELRMRADSLSGMGEDERKRTMFAAEMLRNAQTANEALKQQVFSMQTQMDTVQLLSAKKEMLLGDQLAAIQKVLSPETADMANTAIEALLAGDADTFGSMLGRMSEQARGKEAEALQRLPSQLNELELKAFDPASLGELRTAEDAWRKGTVKEIPEYRYITIPSPAWLDFGKVQKAFTEKQARIQGYEKEWAEAAPEGQGPLKKEKTSKPKKTSLSRSSFLNVKPPPRK